MRLFFLEEIHGREEISGLFHYRVKLTAEDLHVDFKKIMGQAVTVTMITYSEKPRYINGIVTRFIQAGFDGNVTTYYADISPWLWELTLTSDCRIYQNKSVTDIITGVFQEAGFSDFEDRLTGSFEPVEYCVQYRESAFDFVSRLMEESGIFYYFEHTDSKHTLILADDQDVHTPCEGLEAALVRNFEPPDEDIIENVRLEQCLVTGKHSVDDYNFETPSSDLLSEAEGASGSGLKIYTYPGKFGQSGEGEKIAGRMQEAAELPEVLLKGKSYCKVFTAGFSFKLDRHDREDMNGNYILKKVLIRATQDLYTNHFEGFSEKVPFRPALKTRKPQIYGSQTAIVTGKDGEEIWPDKYGRVKVQFHWDREGKNDENSSCWVRVGQVWAGKSWGTMFIPRIGTEVIVSFLGGDPDRPLITGTVYNADQTLPYPMPANKNISTIMTRSTKEGKLGNEIRFDDTKDDEELYFHARKDMNVTVENDSTREILNDKTLTVTGSRTTTIKEKDDTLTVEKGDRVITVSEGAETHSVEGERSLSVTGKESHECADEFSHKVAGNYVLKVDGDLTIDVAGAVTIKAGKDLKEEASMNMELKAGMDLKTEASMNIKNKAGLNFDNEGTMINSKASATQTVDGGGMLTLKGGITKVN